MNSGTTLETAPAWVRQITTLPPAAAGLTNAARRRCERFLCFWK
jgi:hypothetical protein